MPLIKTRLEENPHSRVLDFGFPSSNKLAYLSQSGSRVYWNNFNSGLGKRLRNGSEDADTISEQMFSELFLASDQDKFDVILLWDYLDYLSFDSILEFVARLIPFCEARGWIYFLIAQTPKIPAIPAEIDITLDHTLRYRATAQQRPAPRFAPKVMEENMPGFRINKLYLMKNGIQEHLFQYHPPTKRKHL